MQSHRATGFVREHGGFLFYRRNGGSDEACEAFGEQEEGGEE